LPCDWKGLFQRKALHQRAVGLRAHGFRLRTRHAVTLRRVWALSR
jgi:hypothetical protein